MRLFTVIVLATLCGASSALADRSTRAQCIQDARVEFTACKNVCSDTFTGAKEVCGTNPTCHKACVSDAEACKAPYDEELKTCKEACNDTLEAARNTCKATVGCGIPGMGNPCETNPVFLDCRRPAAVAAFLCRKTCADNQRLNPTVQGALKACRVGERVCHKACRAKPTPTPKPTATPAP